MNNPIKSRVKSQEPPRPLTLDPRQRKQSQARSNYAERSILLEVNNAIKRAQSQACLNYAERSILHEVNFGR